MNLKEQTHTLDNFKQVHPTVQTMKEQLAWITNRKLEELDFSALNARYASLTSDPEIAYMDLYANSNGTEILDSMVGQYQAGFNGQWFRLAKVGATALVKANLLQGAAYSSQFTNMAVLATAIAGAGAQQTATVTNGTTTVNLGDYVNGQVSVYTTPDGGGAYTINGHNTGTSGQNLTLYLDRPLITAWTTSTKVSMTRNPWSGVIQSIATTVTAMPTGFALFAATASTAATTTSEASQQYAWVQTHGMTAMLSDATSILTGSPVSTGSGTAGAVQLHPFTSAGTQVGVAINPAASGHWIAGFSSID